jgi:hypothetical protein
MSGQLTRIGAIQKDRYDQAAEEAYTGLKQTRAKAAADAEAKRRWEAEQTTSAAQHRDRMALQWAQERRAAAQDARDEWSGPIADPVSGGWVVVSKRDPSKIRRIEGFSQGAVSDPNAPAGALPESGLRVTQPGGKAPSEAEMKTGMRAGVGVNALTHLAGVPDDALTPGIAESTANFFGLPAAQQNAVAGMFGGPERVLAKGAQDQFIDQALTEMTGAAYTEHQLNAFRSAYLPTIFDNEASKAEKLNRAYEYVRGQAQAAGRAWTPERDMAFRQMMQQLAGPAPEAAAPAGQRGPGRNFEAEYGLGGP